MICPSCNLTINGYATRCPKCLFDMQSKDKFNNEESKEQIDSSIIDEQQAIPNESINNTNQNKNHENVTDETSDCINVESNEDLWAYWDNTLPTTQNVFNIINTVIKKRSEEISGRRKIINDEYSLSQSLINTNYTKKTSLINKNFSETQNEINKKYDDKQEQSKTEYIATKDEIETKYKNKINEITQEFNKTKLEAENKGASNLQILNVTMREFALFERSIPEFLYNNYQEKKSYSPISTDIITLNSLLSEANKPLNAFLGFLGVIFILIGWVLLGWFFSNRNEKRDKLLDTLESGKEYLKSQINKINNETANAINNAQRIFDNSKADADRKLRDYENTVKNLLNTGKAEADRKLSDFNSKAKKIYNTEKAEADKELRQQQKVNEDYKKRQEDILENDIRNLCDNKSVLNLEDFLKSLLEKYGATEKAWENEFEPSTSYPDELLFGLIECPVTFPEFALPKLKEKMPSCFSMGDGMVVPYTFQMNKPIQLIIDYDKSLKNDVMTGIQSFIFKLLKFMPFGSFKLIFIDPLDCGSNLGTLVNLKYLKHDVCKQVYSSREEIQKKLRELQKDIMTIYEKLAGLDSIYIYNDKNRIPIEYHFIIINDPEKLDRGTLEYLDVIYNNLLKCGISIIFTTNSQNFTLPDNIRNDFDVLKYHSLSKLINFNNKDYTFLFDKLSSVHKDFIKYYIEIFNKEKPKELINNLFSTYFPISEMNTPKFDDATHEMIIPFAVDSNNNLISLKLGGSDSAHALLSGDTGSGKSYTLHMIIMSIIMKYHPNDVELWLVDFKKVAFAGYMNNPPPHVKLIGIGTEGSKEFVCSLIDRIKGEIEYRKNIFGDIEDLADYRKKKGEMLRIVIIIDEFHNLTDITQNEDQYKTKLLNILLEARSFGITCLFCDQAFRHGTQGFPEKGKMNARVRLAMRNEDKDEITYILGSGAKYTEEIKDKIRTMETGDIMFKPIRENIDSKYDSVLDRFKVIHIKSEERDKVITWVLKATGKSKEKPQIFDGQERKEFNNELITEFEIENPSVIDNQIPIYLGTPASLNPCFYFNLRESVSSNIMIIGTNDELRMAVIYWSIYNFKRQNNCKVYILADESDEIYFQNKKLLLSLEDNICTITTKIETICGIISDIKDILRHDNSKILIVWLGLEYLTNEFKNLLAKKPISEHTKQTFKGSTISTYTSVNEFITKTRTNLKAKLGSDYNSEKKQEIITEYNQQELNSYDQTENKSYNAISDIQEITEKGYRNGIFSLVTYSSIISIKRDTDYIKPVNFKHKIALEMPLNDYQSFFSLSSNYNALDKKTAVYYDGGSVTRAFRPYKLEDL